jgi:hypothetical protein
MAAKLVFLLGTWPYGPLRLCGVDTAGEKVALHEDLSSGRALEQYRSLLFYFGCFLPLESRKQTHPLDYRFRMVNPFFQVCQPVLHLNQEEETHVDTSSDLALLTDTMLTRLRIWCI